MMKHSFMSSVNGYKMIALGLFPMQLDDPSKMCLARAFAYQSKISSAILSADASGSMIDNGSFYSVFLGTHYFRFYKGTGQLCSYRIGLWNGYSKPPQWSESPYDFSKAFELANLKISDFEVPVDKNTMTTRNDKPEAVILTKTFWKKDSVSTNNPITCIKFSFALNGNFEVLYWYPGIYKDAEKIQAEWDRNHKDSKSRTLYVLRGSVKDALNLVGENPYMKGDQDLVTGTLAIKY